MDNGKLPTHFLVTIYDTVSNDSNRAAMVNQVIVTAEDKLDCINTVHAEHNVEDLFFTIQDLY